MRLFDRSARRNGRQDRRLSEWRGRMAEWMAAAYLVLKGYRVLARRVRSPYGEIDLVAVRGRRLTFVEVKYRSALASAEAAVTHRQAARLADAALQWVGRRPGYRDFRIGLDAIYLAPWRFPRHVGDALQ